MDISTINLNKETDVVIYENGQKPLKLLERIIKSVINDNDIVLDFFSGSATTAHAVMQLNSEDEGKRKFIMVQLPEKTDTSSEAYKLICPAILLTYYNDSKRNWHFQCNMIKYTAEKKRGW